VHIQSIDPPAKALNKIQFRTKINEICYAETSWSFIQII